MTSVKDLPFEEILKKLHRKKDLSSEEMSAAMEVVIKGSVPDKSIEKFLVYLRDKKETPEEIAAAATVMRHHAVRLSKSYSDLLDTCGTGGDEKATFNVSTLAAIVAAAAGVRIAKHGNRSVSSVCGSADLLEALGVTIELSPEAVEKMIEKTGFGFLFAPKFHPAVRFVMPARKRIKGKTIFNLLGPLSNPAGAGFQLLGVYKADLVETMARVLVDLGIRRAFVVHGLDGLDEISLSDRTNVAEVSNGAVNQYFVSPEDFGLRKIPLYELQVYSRDDAVARAKSVLAGEDEPALNLVAVNAGAALFAAGRAKSIREGMNTAKEILKSGKAKAKLSEIIKFGDGSAATSFDKRK